MNANGHLLESLSQSPTYQDYERAFTEATGMPLALRPVETWQLPLHQRRKENPFCALVARSSRACAACLRMQEALAKSAAEQPATMACCYGLSETAVPVKLGHQTIGFLQTGQVLRHKPTEATFQRAVKKAQEQGLHLDQPLIRDAFFQTPVVPARKLESISGLLTVFADHLSMKSNQIAVRQANAEPPLVLKAKQFIEDHHTEDLSLGQVARVVHTSMFYFCKVFRKATGMTFTEFVSRTRVEKAKGLLLNPNVRISEIAFAVGFQSLTHFNRVFKKIAGESPTEYRAHLPTR